MKHIALLAGSYREFNGWIVDRIANQPTKWERTSRMFQQDGFVFHFLDSHRDVRGLPVVGHEVVGTFYERKDSKEILDATKAQIFSNTKAEGFPT